MAKARASVFHEPSQKARAVRRRYRHCAACDEEARQAEYTLRSAQYQAVYAERDMCL